MSAIPESAMGGLPVDPLDIRGVLQQCAAVASDVCRAHWVAVLLASEEKRLLRSVASHPPGRDLPPVSLDASILWARVVRQNRIEALDDQTTWLPNEWSLLSPEGVGAVLAVPLLINGRSLGALVLGRKAGDAFDEQTRERAQRQARSIADAVERAHLYEEATQRIGELSLLNEVGRAFSESLELEAILETCASRLVELIQTSHCFIFLREGEGLRCAAVSGLTLQDAPDIYIFPDETSINMLALRDRRPVVVVDCESDTRINPRLNARFAPKSCMAVPMIDRGRTIGTLYFGENRRRRNFTNGEIERSSIVASHLASAVDNARLYEDLRRSYADLAEAQAQLVQRERLAALGELAAQVAHEVRNPLGAVFNATAELERRFGREGEVGFLVTVLGEESQRINRIVGDLLEFARPMELNLQPGSLEGVLEDAERATLGRTQVTSERDKGPGLEQVSIDPRLMRQAFLNLMENAVQALSGKGQLRISAHVVNLQGRLYAEVAIEDSGPGVEKDMRERIFEPFFTTKPTGIGLGLPVVKRIAEAHHGTIEVRSSALGGAAFVLRWPAHPQRQA